MLNIAFKLFKPILLRKLVFTIHLSLALRRFVLRFFEVASLLN